MLMMANDGIGDNNGGIMGLSTILCQWHYRMILNLFIASVAHNSSLEGIFFLNAIHSIVLLRESGYSQGQRTLGNLGRLVLGMIASYIELRGVADVDSRSLNHADDTDCLPG